MWGKKSSERGSDRLATRRQQSRRRGLIAFSIALVILFGAIIWGLQQNTARIVRVQIFGADQSLSEIVTTAMQGRYLGIIPRDSIVFFPADKIRSDILAAHPEIAAVSIFRNGLTGVSIKIDNRAPVARWCGAGERLNLENSDLRFNLVPSGCYFFDTKGFVYTATSTAQPINPFVIYESLESTSGPIGVTLPNAEEFPSAFDFARQLSTFGSPVTSITFINDEVSDQLASGTRVTYVVGNEQNAFTALVSSKSNLNLADGSIEYVDLRFDGKVYVKRR